MGQLDLGMLLARKYMYVGADLDLQWSKIIQYRTCPAGRVTYIFTRPANT